MKFSRRDTRFFLVQTLYADIFLPSVHPEILQTSFADENIPSKIDINFFQSIREIVHNHSGELLAIISHFSPKFQGENLPKIHTIILMIALSELKYFSENTPEKIVINEAIELSKIFSDTAGKNFINWVLWNFIKDKNFGTDNLNSNSSFFS